MDLCSPSLLLSFTDFQICTLVNNWPRFAWNSIWKEKDMYFKLCFIQFFKFTKASIISVCYAFASILCASDHWAFPDIKLDVYVQCTALAARPTAHKLYGSVLLWQCSWVMHLSSCMSFVSVASSISLHSTARAKLDIPLACTLTMKCCALRGWSFFNLEGLL